MNTFVNTRQTNAPKQISHAICQCFRQVRKPWDEILILCIGSDRVTGDCLGPLTGALLCRHTFPSVTVYGTLQEPVHACNLEKTLLQIKKRHPAALILAVDASLGNKKHLGYAAIANGALIPGAAVSKNLPPVGDVHITGIVNTAGCQEYLMLQTTRLANVLALSDNIAQGILLAMPAVLSGNLV